MMRNSKDDGSFPVAAPLSESCERLIDYMTRLIPEKIDQLPELVAPVLALLDGTSCNEIHVFWICSADELNELSPAEVLAGKPFDSRRALHPSQRALLELSTLDRVRMVSDLARWRNQDTR